MTIERHLDELDHQPIPVFQDRWEVYVVVDGVKRVLTADAAEITGLRLIKAAMLARQWTYPMLRKTPHSTE